MPMLFKCYNTWASTGNKGLPGSSHIDVALLDGAQQVDVAVTQLKLLVMNVSQLGQMSLTGSTGYQK